MKWIIASLFSAMLIASGSVAQITETDRAALLNEAFILLTEAKDRPSANTAEAEIWALWQIGPDTAATAALHKASAALQAGRLNEAHRTLDALLEAEPNFVEALNQRAFARFLKGDLYGALVDIQATLAREPRHFGALAGRAQVELQLGRPSDAARTMQELGRIHPWMTRGTNGAAIPGDTL